MLLSTRYFTLHFIYLWKYQGSDLSLRRKTHTNSSLLQRVRGRSQIRNPRWISEVFRRSLADPGAGRDQGRWRAENG